MKFKFLMTVLACVLFYFNLVGLNFGGVVGLTLIIYGTLSVFYLKKILDLLIEKQR